MIATRISPTFCTYFDHRYLPRAMLLHESLLRQSPSCRLFALCLTETCRKVLLSLRLPNIVTLSVAEIERRFPDLVKAKADRTTIEYYFTLTPFLPRYVLELSGSDMVTYLDADLWFMSDPQPIFDEIGSGSVAIIPHRVFWPWENVPMGKYNVGWISWRNSKDGIACLDWYCARCLEWCFDRVEEGRFADQKYLERFPELFEGVKIISHKGANVAPWNTDQYRFTVKNGMVFVDEDALIFYHFHGVVYTEDGMIISIISSRHATADSTLNRFVIQPYVNDLVRATRRVMPELPPGTFTPAGALRQLDISRLPII